MIRGPVRAASATAAWLIRAPDSSITPDAPRKRRDKRRRVCHVQHAEGDGLAGVQGTPALRKPLDRTILDRDMLGREPAVRALPGQPDQQLKPGNIQIGAGS